MSGRERKAHNLYCDYEIEKAKQPRMPRIKAEEKIRLGIRKANVSKATLAIQLASLYSR